MTIPTPSAHGTPADPYRIFFPLGVAMGIAGVSIWPLFYWGWTSGYSGLAHAFVQTNCFLYAFIAGFLWTAIPRFTGTNAPGRTVQYILAAILVAELVAFESYGFSTGHLLFLVAHGILMAVIARCFTRRRHPPPETFIFVGLGLLAGAAAAVINAASALVWLSPSWDLLGKRLLTEGMVLLLVLGVGGFLGPRLMGFAQLPNFQNLEKLSERRTVPRMTRWRGRINAVCGVLLLAAVLIEYGWNHPLADLVVWLRAAAVTLIVAINVQPFRAPATQTTLAWCVWIAHWFLIGGVWLIALFRNHHIDYLHVLFMGAFTLLILAVGTRVVLSHGGYPLTDERRSWPLRLGIAATLIGMSARLSVIGASTQGFYFTHLAWAGVLWIAGMAFWGIYLFRRIRRSTS
jgi:uncharacterized protein involved in response to NO